MAYSTMGGMSTDNPPSTEELEAEQRGLENADYISRLHACTNTMVLVPHSVLPNKYLVQEEDTNINLLNLPEDLIMNVDKFLTPQEFCPFVAVSKRSILNDSYKRLAQYGSQYMEMFSWPTYEKPVHFNPHTEMEKLLNGTDTELGRLMKVMRERIKLTDLLLHLKGFHRVILQVTVKEELDSNIFDMDNKAVYAIKQNLIQKEKEEDESAFAESKDTLIEIKQSLINLKILSDSLRAYGVPEGIWLPLPNAFAAPILGDGGVPYDTFPPLFGAPPFAGALPPPPMLDINTDPLQQWQYFDNHANL